MLALPLVILQDALDLFVWYTWPPRLYLRERRRRERLAWLENEAFDGGVLARRVQRQQEGVVERGVAEALCNFGVRGVEGVADGCPAGW